MSTHLSPGVLAALAEGAAVPARAVRHLAGCAACRDEVGALRVLMAELREAEVPEPSPLFWDQFSARVSDAVRESAAAPGRGAGWPVSPWTWRGWAWTLASATAVTALLLLAFGAPAGAPPPMVATLAPGVEAPAGIDPAPGPVLPADGAGEGDDWSLVAEAAGDLDYDDARALGIAVAPGAVELTVHELDGDQREELARLLQEAIARARLSAGVRDTL